MEEEERMWMMAAAAGFSGTLILGLLLYRERLKGKRLVERKKELEEELRKAENEAERIKEAESRLSKQVSELEKAWRTREGNGGRSAGRRPTYTYTPSWEAKRPPPGSLRGSSR